MPEDKNYKKILELNEEYFQHARLKGEMKILIKEHDQQMDRLKKEISELSTIA